MIRTSRRWRSPPLHAATQHCPSADALRASRQRTRRERTFHAALYIATIASLLVLGILLIDTFIDGVPGLSSNLLLNYTSRFADQARLRAGLTGTISLMLLVAAMAFPLGVGAALYLEEFAPRNRFTGLLEANIANLAGVPSVVYGLLGAGVFIYILAMGRTLIVGAITLTLLILPVIIVAGREALRAVPQEIRHGALGLGATPLQTAFRQTLPMALPGIFTGTILALSRAIGETAPILVAGAAFSRRGENVPWELNDTFTALPIQIYQWVSFPQEEFKVGLASAGIIVLLALLLVMNSFAIYLRNRYSRS